jgi:hypothetical protein
MKERTTKHRLNLVAPRRSAVYMTGRRRYAYGQQVGSLLRVRPKIYST